MSLHRFFSVAAIAAISTALPLQAAVTDNPHFKVMGLVVVWGADAADTAPVVSDFVIDTGTGSTAATSGDADLITDDVHTVVTGTLVSTKDSVNSVGSMPFIITNTASGDIDTDTNDDGVLNADDSFSAFGLNANSNTRVDATTTRTSFYVASNTPFAIDVETFVPGSTLDLIMLNITRLQLSVTQAGDDGLAFGSASQFPHSAGTDGGMQPERRLITYLGGNNVFTGDQQTALTRGSLADQSVRFDAEYSIRAANLAGYDLSLGTFDFEVDVVYTVFVP